MYTAQKIQKNTRMCFSSKDYASYDGNERYIQGHPKSQSERIICPCNQFYQNYIAVTQNGNQQFVWPPHNCMCDNVGAT